MFEVPKKVAARAIDHRIDLIDPRELITYPWLYKLSKNKFSAIKYTIRDYL